MHKNDRKGLCGCPPSWHGGQSRCLRRCSARAKILEARAIFAGGEGDDVEAAVGEKRIIFISDISPVNL